MINNPIVDGLSNPILILNKNRVITYVNWPLLNNLGYLTVDLIDKPFAFFLHEEEVEDVDRKLLDCLKGIVPTFDRKLRFLKAKGGWDAYETSVSRLYSQADNETLVIQLKNTIAGTNDQELSTEIMDNLPIGLAVNTVFPTVNFMYMNDLFPLFYNTDRKDLANPDSFWAAVYEDSDFRGEIRKRVLDDIASGDPKRTLWENIPITRKGEQTRYISAHMIPVPGKDIIISTVADVTSQNLALEALRESEERYRNILEVAPVGIAVLSEDKIVFVNPKGMELLGAESIEQLIGKPINEIVHPLCLEKTGQRIKKLLEGEKDLYPAEDIYVKLDGTPINVEVIASLLIFNNKPAVQVIVSDITTRKNNEQEREALLQLTRSMFNDHDAIMLLIEPMTGMIHDVNSAASTFYGYTKEELLHLRIQDINMLPDDEVQALRLKAYKKNQKYYLFPHRLKSGEIRLVDVYTCPITHQGQKLLFSIIFDVTEREKLKEELIYLSYHDHLTGLYNRRFFERELERLDEEENLPITLVMGDVNGLKLVNDSFGHKVGDELLKKVAGLLTQGCRTGDVIARIGGDEFGIIMPKTDELKAEEMIKTFKTWVSDIELEKSLLSISFGYETKKSKNENNDAVLAKAENYMYQHKMYESASMRNNAIDVIMNALFEKSEREMQHSGRVSNISAAIATKIGLDTDEINAIRVAGLLHDIGKIGLDEKILNKAGKLNDEEWETIQKHPEAGWRILASVKEFSDLAKYILYHHERWDGTGYPEGLKGDKIPVESRIISLADAFDAMTKSRTYRGAMSHEEAIEELKRGSGTQFDPEILEVFIKMLLKSKSEFN